MKRLMPLIVLASLIFASAMAAPPIPNNYQMSSPSGYLQNEEQIWVSPIDSLVLVADWRDFQLGYRQVGIGVSWDGGDSWFANLIPLGNQIFDRQSDPTLTVDNDGNFYVCVLDYDASADYDSSYITFLKSTDNGWTWSSPVTVEDSIGPYFEDKQFITCDRTGGPYEGNIYLAWARFPNPTRIMFARSTDGAASFDDTLIVGPSSYDSSSCGYGDIDAGQFACPLVGSNGDVYVSWIGTDLDTSTCYLTNALRLVKSTDGGATFTDPRSLLPTAGNWWQVDGGVDVYNQPTMAADLTGGPHDGNLYIAYANLDYIDNPIYDHNIEFIRSLDDGETWTEPIYINDDYTGDSALFDQFHPWLFCNEQEGTLVAIWYDQRTDPNHYLFDVFAAYSFDGGETFTTNHRISDVSIDPDQLAKSADEADDQPRINDPAMAVTRNDTRAGLIAEYIGVTAFRDHVNACWTDTRYGQQDVFGANWVIPFMEPRLVSPEDSSAIPDPAIDFVWSTCWKEDDDHYRLEVSSDSAFTSIDTCESDDNTYTYSGPNVQPGYWLYWRVKAFQLSTGDSSDYSETFAMLNDLPDCYSTVDIDNDGLTLSAGDYDYLVNFVEGLGPAPEALYQADLNGDCKVNHFDVALFDDYLEFGIGVFPEFPILSCCEVDTVRGACCVGDSCYTLDAPGCDEVYSGTYMGDGIYCATDPCPVTCCEKRGDIDHNGSDPDIADLIYLVTFMFQEGPLPPCDEPFSPECPEHYFPETDVNNDGVCEPDIADLIYLVTFMFQEGPALVPCP